MGLLGPQIAIPFRLLFSLFVCMGKVWSYVYDTSRKSRLYKYIFSDIQQNFYKKKNK